MAVMAAAAGAMVLGARQQQLEILPGFYMPWQDVKEAGPAGAAVVFEARGKQVEAATGTDKHAVALFLVERAGKGPLGSFLAQHVVLLRGEQLLPFIIALVDAFDAFRERSRRHEQAIAAQHGHPGTAGQKFDKAPSVHIMP